MKNYFLSLVAVAMLSGSIVSQAVVFQNNNVACESELTLCDSSMAACAIGTDTFSVSCKNIEEEADFNGDAFPDCAASVAVGPGVKQFSTFLNKGNAATNCDQITAGFDYDLFVAQGANPFFFGSIVTGQLGGTAVSDIAVPNVIDMDEQVYMVLGNGVMGGFGDPANPLTPQKFAWDPTAGNSQAAGGSHRADRNAMLMDCDGDSDLDFVMSVSDTVGVPQISLFLNVLRNNNGSLQPTVPADVSFVVEGGDASFGALATADFNQDGNLDIVMAARTDAGVDSINVCLNDGACHFANTPCLSIPATAQSLFSVAAGDFNGDGNQDFVISKTVARSLKFFFGDGTGAFSDTAQTTLELPLSGSAPAPANTQVTLTTGCFNNDNRLDVAASYTQDINLNRAQVNVLSLQTNSTLKSQDTLMLSNTATFAGGIDAADFDQQGGDDLMVVATDTSIDPLGDRRMFVLMNELETLTATATLTPNQILEPGQLLSLTGVCALSPVDPDAEFETLWTVTGSPAGSNPVLTGADTLTPTFVADQLGDYALMFSCRTRCDAVTTDAVQFKIISTPPPTPLELFTQGGCVSNNLDPKFSYSFGSLVILLSNLSVLLWYRKKS